MEKGLQALNNQNKLALWSERISECRSSGQHIKAWCKDHGICEQTYYKWQKKLFAMAQAQQESRFAEITPTCTSGSIAVTVRIAGAEADIHAGADAVTVEAVLRILKSC